MVSQPSLEAGQLVRPLNEEMTLQKSAPNSRTRRSRSGGFSMVELAVSLTVLLILTAIAIPTLMRSFRTYQLNDAAARLSDMLKFTRFEAVRRNTQVQFLMQQPSPPAWIIGVDSNGNSTIDLSEKQEVIAGFATLLPSGTPPSPTAIVAKLGGASLNTLSGSTGSVTFDARGAIRVGGTVSANIFVFYIGSANDPESGYRAVILLPSGSTQIWTAPSGGTWQQIS
jgi:type II secretory pathway pseudopilin PulG